MTDLQRKVKVTNRTAGSLGYEIESLRALRVWSKPGDYLNIAIDELLELKTIEGGMSFLEKRVVIEDEEAIRIVFDDQEVAPEYRYGIKEVDFLLYEATLEQFLDALDYSPEGVLDLIKENAKRKLPNTTAKISAINEKFGINVNRVNEFIVDTSSDKEEKDAPTARRAAPIAVEPEGKAPKYKVVSRDK